MKMSKKSIVKSKKSKSLIFFCHIVVESKLISINYKGQPNSERTMIQYANSFLIFLITCFIYCFEKKIRNKYLTNACMVKSNKISKLTY